MSESESSGLSILTCDVCAMREVTEKLPQG